MLLLTKEVFFKTPKSYRQLYEEWLKEQTNLKQKLMKKPEEKREDKIRASITLLCLIIGMALQGIAALIEGA